MNNNSLSSGMILEGCIKFFENNVSLGFAYKKRGGAIGKYFSLQYKSILVKECFYIYD
ncbi:hypothetical protein JCM21714_3972 [Gracilibacillus boraciitolerans JCM 21714]|uniref:Uncharacterized protein n=1 Tax=Gracilibacillus boraciitolerans JCM 21714 TaxID=1298598 RepID=W4VNJ4_9BACI|nr:hypothetical protein JCM21714_3972 [Gracilibacillus boraciitolerans JCM 21714]